VSDTEQIRPLELLHRMAGQLGAVVLLTSRRRGPDGASTLHTLHKLLVVRPARDATACRRDALTGGTVLASLDARGTVLLEEGVSRERTLDDCASVLVSRLAPLVAETR
jgi:hypothetical protein